MKKHTFQLLFLLILFLLYSCQDDGVDVVDVDSPNLSSPPGMMVLGEQIDNPYSIENMKEAYESLKSSGRIDQYSISNSDIVPTHLYIRILPKDGSEVNWAIDDTTMEFFDYPLDYEILVEGSYYQDPKIPFGKPTWLYTTVPVDFVLPDMNCEILEECYIPNYGVSIMKGKKEKEFGELMECEAFKISENIEGEKKNSQEVMASAVPSGRFRVYNSNSSGLDPVRRVKVRVHRVVKWDVDYTDDSGYYQMTTSFTYDPHYALIFENENGFKIWGNWYFLAPANYNMGYYPNTGHSKDFWKDSQGWPWCSVNNAICEHRDYCDLKLITRPPDDLRIWVLDSENGKKSGATPMLQTTYGYDDDFDSTIDVEYYYDANNDIVITGSELLSLVSFCLPDMFIIFDKDYQYASTNMLKSLVYHEASHASHYMEVGRDYWIQYIKFTIAQWGYGTGTENHAWYCGWGEMWANYFGMYLCANYYTGYNILWQPTYRWFKPGVILDVDLISDVETYEILDALSGDIVTLEGLINNLHSKTLNDIQIDGAFNDYVWP